MKDSPLLLQQIDALQLSIKHLKNENNLLKVRCLVLWRVPGHSDVPYVGRSSRRRGRTRCGVAGGSVVPLQRAGPLPWGWAEQPGALAAASTAGGDALPPMPQGSSALRAVGFPGVGV